MSGAETSIITNAVLATGALFFAIGLFVGFILGWADGHAACEYERTLAPRIIKRGDTAWLKGGMAPLA